MTLRQFPHGQNTDSRPLSQNLEIGYTRKVNQLGRSASGSTSDC